MPKFPSFSNQSDPGVFDRAKTGVATSPVPEHPATAKPAAGAVFVAGRADPGPSEAADNYPAVVARLTPTWRVANSRERFPYRQWILQQRTNPNRWRGRSYCQIRVALELAVAWRVGLAEVKLLAALPNRIGGGGA